MIYSVAIDGPSGAGKSSISKLAAKRLGITYVDTGAIYRTAGLASLRAGADTHNEDEVKAALEKCEITIGRAEDGSQSMLLNGTDVSSEIRSAECSRAASDVSSLPYVRQFLLDMQRKTARSTSVIMDGRDIGTVVLPEAKVKIYLTASVDVRAQRRLLEMQEKGQETTFEAVKASIEYRDNQDMNRPIAPLKQADDAVLLDTSDLSFDESLEAVCAIIEEKIKEGNSEKHCCCC